MTDSRSRRKATSRESVPRRGPGSVRWSKVLTAQARMAVGYYDRSDVKEMVLDAVLEELKRH